MAWLEQDDGSGGVYRLYKDSEGALHSDYGFPDYEAHLELLKNMEMREDDVIVVGYPKSGNHWLYEIVHMIVEQSAEYSPKTFAEVNLDQTSLSTTSALPSPRVLQTHLPPNRLPTQVTQKRVKLVIVLRNPKDVCVSYYNFTHKIKVTSPFKGPFEKFFQYFIQGTVACGKWTDHVKAYERFSTDNPTHPEHVLAYEGMKENPASEVKRLSAFIGKSLSDDEVASIVSKTQFNKMTPELNSGKLSIYKKVFEPGAEGIFRKGIVGDWRSVFTEQQNEVFDAMLKESIGSSPMAELVLPYC